MTTRIGAVVLAAGFSNRFGSIKLCAALRNGQTVYEQTLTRIAAAVQDILVVTRPELSASLPKVDVPVISFDQAERGMGATLAFAISQVMPWQAALVCLADMPFIRSETYGQIAAAVDSETIVIPRVGDQTGNPVAFGQAFFPALCQLSGDAGGRRVAQSHPEQVRALETQDAGILADIDTPEDLQRYQDSISD